MGGIFAAGGGAGVPNGGDGTEAGLTSSVIQACSSSAATRSGCGGVAGIFTGCELRSGGSAFRSTDAALTGSRLLGCGGAEGVFTGCELRSGAGDTFRSTDAALTGSRLRGCGIGAGEVLADGEMRFSRGDTPPTVVGAAFRSLGAASVPTGETGVVNLLAAVEVELEVVLAARSGVVAALAGTLVLASGVDAGAVSVGLAIDLAALGIDLFTLLGIVICWLSGSTTWRRRLKICHVNQPSSTTLEVCPTKIPPVT